MSREELQSIGACCFDCGRQFLTEKQKNRVGVVTAWMETCPLCRQHTSLTNVRHFNYLRKPDNATLES